MKLVIGLGNPGKKYQNTRHNIGKNLITKLIQTQDLSTKNFPKLQAELVQIYAGLPAGRQGTDDKIFIGYPTTYMNLSGNSVQNILNYFKIDPQDIYIVHDDLDLEVGEWKLQFNRGPAGHNGIKSIIDSISTQAFWRLRIGIGHPRSSVASGAGDPVEDYVLKPFSGDEKVIIDQTIDKILPELKNILDH